MRTPAALVALLVGASPLVALAAPGVVTLDLRRDDYDTAIYNDPDMFGKIERAVSGDFNGDGILDLVIAGCEFPTFNDYYGMAWVFFGPVAQGDVELRMDSADVLFIGALGNATGDSLSAGDVNGDGFDDLLLEAGMGPGSPFANPAACGIGCGEAYIVWGSASWPPVWDLAVRPPAVVVLGGERGRRLHFASIRGDLDQDGAADLYLNSGNNWPNATMWIQYGGTGLASTIDLQVDSLDVTIDRVSPTPIHNTGRMDLPAVADFNGDRIQDLVLGTRHTEGKGPLTGEYAIHYGTGTRLTGFRWEDRPGSIVLEGAEPDRTYMGGEFTVGDFNGDGYVDFLGIDLGAFGPVQPRTARVVLGRPSWPGWLDLATDTDLTLRGRESFSTFGIGFAVGDFDGDGYDDIAISDRAELRRDDATKGGAVFLYMGHPAIGGDYRYDAYTRRLEIFGDTGFSLGSPLALVDLNADGYDDLVSTSLTTYGPNRDYPRGVSQTIVVRGCQWDTCCDLWRDDRLNSIDPLSLPRAEVMPLSVEDCYRWRAIPGASDPELEILGDAGRPLVLYATPRTVAGLRLVKGAGDTVRVWY